MFTTICWGYIVCEVMTNVNQLFSKKKHPPNALYVTQLRQVVWTVFSVTPVTSNRFDCIYFVQLSLSLHEICDVLFTQKGVSTIDNAREEGAQNIRLMIRLQKMF